MTITTTSSIKLTPTQERALRAVAGVSLDAAGDRGSSPTLRQFRRLVELGLIQIERTIRTPIDFLNHASDYVTTAAGDEWLKVKTRVHLTNAQINALSYFAGVAGVDGSKPNNATYARLRSLRLIEMTGPFPYHRPTAAGYAWLGLRNDNCEQCTGTERRHYVKCPVAMDEEARKIEAEAPRGTCGRCSYPLVWVHEMWIGADGSERCASGDPHRITQTEEEYWAGPRPTVERAIEVMLDALSFSTRRFAIIRESIADTLSPARGYFPGEREYKLAMLAEVDRMEALRPRPTA